MKVVKHFGGDAPYGIIPLKAYKYTPDDPKLNYDIGNYYMMLQNVAKAREFWTNGLRTSPSDPNLNNALRSIQGR